MTQAKRIYVADDEHLILQTLDEILKREGFEVETFSDAESVLARMKESEPDLVLTDVVMNGPMSGLTLAETIAYEHPLVRVILMSGQAKTSELLENFHSRGLNPLVEAKPLAPARLIAQIKGLLMT